MTTQGPLAGCFVFPMARRSTEHSRFKNDPFTERIAWALTEMAARSQLRDVTLRVDHGTAQDFLSRVRELIRKPATQRQTALLRMNRNFVHTWFRWQPRDLVYLDQHAIVQKLVRSLPPWRISRGGSKARHAMELKAGTIEHLGIRAGRRLGS